MRTILAPLLLCGLLTPVDLDVPVPPGSPLDALRLPPPVDPNVGRPRYPSQLRRLPKVPQAIRNDALGHLKWGPERKGRLEKFEDAPAEWNMSGYPPPPTENASMTAMMLCAVAVLRSAQASEAELAGFLIEMGDIGAMAADAAKPQAPRLAAWVTSAVGKPPKDPPKRPENEIERYVVQELATKNAYDADFGDLLTTLHSGHLLQILEKILTAEENSVVARNAAFLLRCFDDPKVLPLLRKAMKSKDKVVRNRAVAALTRWKDLESLPWLAEQLKGEDVPFRSMACWALGRIGTAAAFKELLAAAGTGDAEFAWSALPALCRTCDDLSDADRTALLETLGGLEPMLARVEDPKPGATPENPDPSGTRRAVLTERLRIAKARAGNAEQAEWMTRLGTQGASREAKVQCANVDFFNETLDFVRFRIR